MPLTAFWIACTSMLFDGVLLPELLSFGVGTGADCPGCELGLAELSGCSGELCAGFWEGGAPCGCVTGAGAGASRRPCSSQPASKPTVAAATSPIATTMYHICVCWRRSSAAINSIASGATNLPQAGHTVPASTCFPHCVQKGMSAQEYPPRYLLAPVPWLQRHLSTSVPVVNLMPPAYPIQPLANHPTSGVPGS